MLQDVSCGGTGSCVAVGGFGNPEGATLPTLATLSEGEWIVEQAPLPAGALPGSEATLGTVSCPSPGNRSAGLDTGPGDQQETFTLDQSSGSWGAPTEVTMANGQGAAGLSLTSMSCPSAGNCAAVGYYSRPGALFVHAYVVDETGGVWGPAPGGHSPRQCIRQPAGSGVLCLCGQLRRRRLCHDGLGN